MTKYKLYRDFKELLNPSISRQNISNYKIIVNDDFLPIDVYYPNKEVNIDHIIIYLTKKDQDICKDLAILTEQLVLTIDVLENTDSDKCYDLIKYIYNQATKYNIFQSNITLICDNSCDGILNNIDSSIRENKDLSLSKKIFLESHENVKVNTNKLVITDIRSPYNFYSKKQFYEIIKCFILN